jgi:disulfide bond formation protein DsbB
MVNKHPIESEFSLRKHAKAGASQPKSLSQETPAPKPQPEVQPTKSTKDTVTSATTTTAKDTATEAPTATTPWNIVIVLFLASLGLLWWIFKRRS